MGILESPTPQHWNYLLALEDDVYRLSRYVELTADNFDTYSIELARMLFSAASEVDVVAKQICKNLDPASSAENINVYRSELMQHRPQIAKVEVLIPKFGLTLTPWERWDHNQNPAWWGAYNKVKHDRHNHFSKANLQNVLNAVAGLFGLLLFHYSKEAQEGNLSPNPALLRIGAPFQVDTNFWAPQNLIYRLPGA